MVATKGPVSTETPRIRVGSHLRVMRYGYWHHGVYIGRKRMIHFSAANKAITPTAVIREDSLEDFIYGGPMDDQARSKQVAEIVEYEVRLPSKEIVERARSKIGSADYSLFGNNCEHFATWCVTGSAVSGQVNTVVWYGAIGHLVKNLLLETEAGKTALNFTKEAAIAIGAVVGGGALFGIIGAAGGAAYAASRHMNSESDDSPGAPAQSEKA